ncbi:hypothetical protein CSC2_43720 [Clostridium zeae]|uniref:CAAX prenyl protease 2/Lysostaphin resistance protein A-like domain-containing protein n=1 Tax=Clostridium zeae TaxID=2759022 RepID=A0ABQ1EGP2_9CLOT|nr:CPBP family intramembrane glutamic endopeptidase [Clostridium zeae]GFZ33846.1 hypothetical protein CSC2_43720 [Clostridium zeae]
MFVAIVLILKIILVSFISLLLSLAAIKFVHAIGIDIKDFKQRTKPIFLFIAAIFNLIFVGVVFLILRYIDNKPFNVLGFLMNIRALCFSLIALAATLLMAFIFIKILQKFKVFNVRFMKNYFSNSQGILALILGYLVLFIAAFQEELMFRGYFTYLLQPYGFITAMLLSSIIFTVWHFITNKVNLFQALDWLLGGLMLFYVYTRTGSIWASTIVHFSRNFANVLLLNIAQSNSLFEFDKPIPPKYKTIYTLTLSIVIALITYLFYR